MKTKYLGNRFRKGLVVSGIVGILGGTAFSTYNYEKKREIIENKPSIKLAREYGEKLVNISKLGSELRNASNYGNASYEELKKEYDRLMEENTNLTIEYERLIDSEDLIKTMQQIEIYSANFKAGRNLGIGGLLLFVMGVSTKRLSTTRMKES